VTDEELDEFIDYAQRRLDYAEEWWLDDFFEEAIQAAKELKELRAKSPAPIQAWMLNCKAFKCGCQGNPQWHADKAAAEEKRQAAARESRKS
jgi:hypothetical protein